MSDKTLPPSWRWVPLAELAAREPNAITDGPFGSKLKTAHYTESGPRVVRLQNVGEGQFLDERAHISESHFNSLQKHRVYPGDLVIAALGETLPRACMIPASLGPAIVKADCIRFKPDAKTVSPKFLLYSLLSPQLREQAGSIIHGVGRPRLNQSEIKSLRVPLAPPVEQERIVAEIEKQFTRLDAGIAAIRRLQAHLKRYRAAVLMAACEGRLVPTEAELARIENRSYQAASDLVREAASQRREYWVHDLGKVRYVEPARLDAEPGPLPEGWTWATFEQISGRVTVGHVGPMKDEYVESGVPFLRSQNVRENRFDREGLLFVSPQFHAKLTKSVLRPGDIVIVRSGAVGTACVVPESIGEANCSDLVILQRPLGLVPAFAAFYMNSLARARVRAGQVGIALTHFNTKSVAALPVPVPPLAEQRRIVTAVETKLSDIDAIEAAVVANLSRARKLRSAALKAAFEGSLVPHTPGDNPVNVAGLREVAGDSAAEPVMNTKPSSVQKAGVR